MVTPMTLTMRHRAAIGGISLGLGSTPNQLAALRRLGAAFGIVLILEVREHEPGRDPAPDQAPRLVDDDQAPEPEPPERR
jgi:hypothetical protein